MLDWLDHKALQSAVWSDVVRYHWQSKAAEVLKTVKVWAKSEGSKGFSMQRFTSKSVLKNIGGLERALKPFLAGA